MFGLVWFVFIGYMTFDPNARMTAPTHCYLEKGLMPSSKGKWRFCICDTMSVWYEHEIIHAETNFILYIILSYMFFDILLLNFCGQW